jgi:hypothetical protein
MRLRLVVAICVGVWLVCWPMGSDWQVRAGVTRAPLKLALIIGHNHGGAALPVLRFAQRDARRLARLLVTLGGFSRSQIELLLSPTPAKVRAAMKRLRKRAIASKRKAMFVLYYSGHAQNDHFQLGNRTMAFGEMMRFSRTLPVRVRILIVDSCFSGRFLRMKGARRKSSIKWLPKRVRTRGLAILTSSEANGRSFESDRIRGSLFTSSLLAGLRGAADKNADQRISLSELRNYVYQKTLARSAEQSSEVQRPSHRLELQGQGALFLTYLKKGSARVSFPNKMEGHFFLYRGTELVQDFRKQKGESLRVAVHGGAYRLQVRRHGWLGHAAFRVQTTKDHRIRTADFRWKQLSVRQQMKGGPGTSAPLGVGASVHYNPVANLSNHSLGVLLGVDSGRWLRIGVGYRFGMSNMFGLPYETHTLRLRLAAGYGLGKGAFGIWLGAHIDPLLVVRTTAISPVFHAGFSAGALCHLDYYLLPELALRIVVSGGAEFLLFDQNLTRTTAHFDMGVGFVWRP